MLWYICIYVFSLRGPILVTNVKCQEKTIIEKYSNFYKMYKQLHKRVNSNEGAICKCTGFVNVAPWCSVVPNKSLFLYCLYSLTKCLLCN